MDSRHLRSGDPVFHPRHGFGVMQCTAQHDIADLAGDRVAGHTEDYYEIQLLEGGVLLVPVARAEHVGLRRLANRLEDVEICLRSPAEALPIDSRQRVAELRIREQAPEPTALASGVRDLLPQRRRNSLSATEKNWLGKACDRLSQEVALVEHVSVAEARAAIWKIVDAVTAA